MATTILAAGTTAATSSDVTLAVGEAVTLFLTGAGAGTAPAGAACDIEFKRSDATYTQAYRMAWTGRKQTARFDGPVTFRIKRPVCAQAVGVDRA